MLNLILDGEDTTRPRDGEPPDDPFTSIRLQRLAGEIYQSATSSSSLLIIVFSYTREDPEGDPDPLTEHLSFRQIENTRPYGDSTDTSMFAALVEDSELPYLFPGSSVLQHR